MKFIERDALEPTALRHHCQEMFEGDQLEQIYNYLVYEFDLGDSIFRARAYLHEIDKISVFGPYREDKEVTGELDERIIAYFKRRYQQIDRFQTTTGYTTVWTRN